MFTSRDRYRKALLDFESDAEQVNTKQLSDGEIDNLDDKYLDQDIPDLPDDSDGTVNAGTGTNQRDRRNRHYPMVFYQTTIPTEDIISLQPGDIWITSGFSKSIAADEPWRKELAVLMQMNAENKDPDLNVDPDTPDPDTPDPDTPTHDVEVNIYMYTGRSWLTIAHSDGNPTL
jgi:hypothetical protein